MKQPAPARSLVLAVLAWASVAHATEPTIHPNGDPAFAGQYVIAIETPPVLDYSQSAATPDVTGTIRTLAQDEKGRIVGWSTTHDGVIDSAGIITGKVSSKKHLPFVQLKIVDVGEIDGDPTKAVGKVTAQLSGWGDASRLVGELALKFCMAVHDPIVDRVKKICAPSRTPIDEAVRHAGSWQVRLVLERFGDQLFGPGWIVTGVRDPATTRFFEVEAVGKISPRSGLATVRLLSRVDPSPGSVTLIGPVADDADGASTFTAIHEVKGKLLGQKFAEVFDSNE